MPGGPRHLTAYCGLPVLPEELEETALPNRQSLLDNDALDMTVSVSPKHHAICSFVNRLWIYPIGTSR